MTKIQSSIEQGIHHLNTGNLQEAEIYFLQVLDVDRNYADAWHLLGIVSAQKKEYTQAIEQILRALRIKPNEALYYKNLAKVYQDQGDIELAITHYSRTIELNPQWWEVYFTLGCALLNCKDFIGAIRYLEPFIEAHPDNIDAHNLLRHAYDQLEELDRPKFLLIKAWGHGFWSDVDHVLGQLLIAELTNRIPIVHWGSNSRYRNQNVDNAFEDFFEPVSPYSIDDLSGQSYSYYPPKWTESNLKDNRTHFLNTSEYRLSGFSQLSRQENVVVSDTHCYVNDLISCVDTHPSLASKSTQEVYTYLFHKYLKLKPHICDFIEKFWQAKLANSNTLAVHVRGSDKNQEVSSLGKINEQYHSLIEAHMSRISNSLIFLLTDDNTILEEYQHRYGDNLIHTDATRSSSGLGVHYQRDSSPTELGMEIIIDTYLAARCDYFIGNGLSNVSSTILHLKEWHPDHCILLAYNQLLGHSVHPRRLHIGGTVKTPGWEVLNALPGPSVDHLGNANDLSRFSECTFSDIYASHVVEHFDYVQELISTLKNWHRALIPGGKLYISVPDMDILARLYLDREQLTMQERFNVMRMMFGGHTSPYDYHQVGLNQELLINYLQRVGFSRIRRVDKFGFFNDTSNYCFKGVPISLNIIAQKPF